MLNLMNKSKLVRVLTVIIVLAGLAQISFAAKPTEPESSQPENNPSFHELLLDAAAKYSTFGKVDDMARWAPALCAAPPPPAPKVSKSADPKTHGQKLYFLFVKDRDSYLKIGHINKPPTQDDTSVGQVIVKESWTQKKTAEKTVGASNGTTVGPQLTADIKSSLFIMVKTNPKTPDTDEGWVYGTVTADGTTVTSAGRVASCMSCHQQVGSGRLFGLKAEAR